MMKFKVGDRVRFNSWPFNGRIGTVIRVVQRDLVLPYDVDIDGATYPTAEKEIERVD